eukprot:3219915-Alexandrium_andersonii.AAC.1
MAPTPATPFDVEPALGAGRSWFCATRAPAAPRRMSPENTSERGNTRPMHVHAYKSSTRACC